MPCFVTGPCRCPAEVRDDHELRLQVAVQENEYYFRGFVSMADLAVLFAEYPFEEDTLEKAAIHRRSMERGVTPFSVTLRAMPDTGWTAEGEDLVFNDTRWEIRDGKSRVAAVSKNGRRKPG